MGSQRVGTPLSNFHFISLHSRSPRCPVPSFRLHSLLPGSSVHGILQARTLKWVSCPPPGDLPDPGIEPVSPATPALQADSLLLRTGEALSIVYIISTVCTCQSQSPNSSHPSFPPWYVPVFKRLLQISHMSTFSFLV